MQAIRRMGHPMDPRLLDFGRTENLELDNYKITNETNKFYYDNQ